MPIYLKTDSSNIALKTGGVPQSQINNLLADQAARLEAEHQIVVDGLNTEINDLGTEINGLENVITELNTENDNLEAEIVGLNADKDALNAEVDSLEEEVDKLQAIVDDMPIPVEGVAF